MGNTAFYPVKANPIFPHRDKWSIKKKEKRRSLPATMTLKNRRDHVASTMAAKIHQSGKCKHSLIFLCPLSKLLLSMEHTEARQQESWAGLRDYGAWEYWQSRVNGCPRQRWSFAMWLSAFLCTRAGQNYHSQCADQQMRWIIQDRVWFHWNQAESCTSVVVVVVFVHVSTLNLKYIMVFIFFLVNQG